MDCQLTIRKYFGMYFNCWQVFNELSTIIQSDSFGFLWTFFEGFGSDRFNSWTILEGIDCAGSRGSVYITPDTII